MTGPAPNAPGRSPVAAFLGLEARKQRGALRLAAACAAAAAAGATLLLGLSGWFLAGAALAGAAGASAVLAFNYLLPSAGMRLFAVARTGGRYGERLFGHQAALRALAALRPALFAGLAAAPPERSLALASGEASARLVQDVDALETAFIRRSAPWGALAGAGAAAVGVALASVWATAAFLAGLAVQLALGRWLAARWTRAPAKDVLEAAGRLKSGLNAYAGAAAELRAFGLAGAAVDALMEHDQALGQAGLRRARAEASLGLLEAAPTAVTLTVVAALTLHAPRPLTALALLSAFAGFEAAGGLLRAAEQAQSHEEALLRLDSLIERPVAREPAPAPDAVLRIDGCSLAPGGRLALTGPSGCGKTRTLQALLGLRPAPAGRLAIADRPLEAAPTGWARALFAYAPQDAQMITGAVAENLRLAALDADDEALWAALGDAQLDARVRRMANGLHTWIGDGGETLSGGERRRLALARAYLSPAPWLVLDEPTEGLDAATEAAVVDALARRLDRTGQGLLLVSHRTRPLALCPQSLPLARAP
ncbi:MAG TPA: ATP-binding cassette domain-containing protein [Caulobacteraceae bacterium]|nr:ATP-binding cassette domain-containing protein [Caulobacteraceae bacterium]